MNTLDSLKVKPYKTVYSYLAPEVKTILDNFQMSLPRDFYSTRISRESFYRICSLFNPILPLDYQPDGKFLDEIDEIVRRRLVDTYDDKWVRGLEKFKYCYPTSGSSEAIFHVLNRISQHRKYIYTVLGEYEGYSIYAKELGLLTNSNGDPLKSEGNVWLLSYPSAVDGNKNDKALKALNDSNNEIHLDLSYMGSTNPDDRLDVLPLQNVKTVFISMSKPFGMFRYRVGWVFSGSEIPSLEGNKWFKDPVRQLQALKVLEYYDKFNMLNRKEEQRRYVKEINNITDLPMKSSDSYLLGHLTKDDEYDMTLRQVDSIKEYKRGNGYRFCLTPYFEMGGIS